MNLILHWTLIILLGPLLFGVWAWLFCMTVSLLILATIDLMEDEPWMSALCYLGAVFFGFLNAVTFWFLYEFREIIIP